MSSRKKIRLSLFILLAVAGCASAKVTERQQLVAEKLPRPGNILVYDFASTPDAVPADSAVAGQISQQTAARTEEEMATGRRVCNEIASRLVEQIRSMGLPAERTSDLRRIRPNDIVIRGYLLSVNEGNAAKRFVIGFGSGASELKVALEGFQVTPRGLRKLGSGTVSSEGSKAPGGVVGLGMAIASGSPVGLIASSGVKLIGERSGRSGIEGRVDQIVGEIAEQLRIRFEEQGWI